MADQVKDDRVWHWVTDVVSGDHWHFDGGCYDKIPDKELKKFWKALCIQHFGVTVKRQPQHWEGPPVYTW